MISMRTIAIMNNKGGVGKTVTAINLADVLDRVHGKRVVLVDCDGQMNLTRFFLPGYDPDVSCNLVSVMRGEGESVWSDNLTPVGPQVDLLPATPELFTVDLQAFTDAPHRRLHALRQFIEAAEEDGETDFFILDCPPGFTVASVSALMAADEVIIPLTLDGFGFEGMAELERQVGNLMAANYRVRIGGVLITQWRNTDVVHQAEALLRSGDVPVYRTVIRRTEKVPESTFARMPIMQYSPTSAASYDYRQFAAELLEEV